MARADAMGLFWYDAPKVKVLKEKVRCVPPERTWEKDDYLPNLQEALDYKVPYIGDYELASLPVGTKFVFDIECYPNYFLLAFMDILTKKVVYFERINEVPFDSYKLEWMLKRFCIIGFNSLSYDLPVMTGAMYGLTNEQLHFMTEEIIQRNERGSDVLKRFKIKKISKCDHIDLIEVAPLRGSLKIYGGRLHTPRMQDLPFKPGIVLNDNQIAITRYYCINDLTNTEALYQSLTEQLNLREAMSRNFDLDLRSKSDAQIAEAILNKELTRYNGSRPQVPLIPIGTKYKYRLPAFIKYTTDRMNWVLQRVLTADFIVGEAGSCGTPPELEDFKVTIGQSTYQMGIGGLHSCEKSAAHYSTDTEELEDRDVTSYYPFIMLLLNIYPQHLGESFLQVFGQIVNRRLNAKRTGNKAEADSLKITINGTFGKTGNKYSILYSPDLVIQVTLTGQLSLLMLIERLELAGIPVVSANTDGIVIKCPRTMVDVKAAIIKQWEADTGFETEGAFYRALFSKDVNNYIAVKTDGTTKKKGVYANPWNEKKAQADRLNKNPVNTICIEAVERFIVDGVPLMTTIEGCNDIRKFITVRQVKGGAVKDGVYYGKSLRWYYAKGETGVMILAATGGTVPRSQGAKPCLNLPEQLPTDIDYDWYFKEAESILNDIGYFGKEG